MEWALVLLVLGPLLAFVLRWRSRNSTEQAEEVQRLALLAAAEAEQAETEAVREYTASIMREAGRVPQPPSVVYDDASSLPVSSTRRNTRELAASSRMVDEGTDDYQESAPAQNTTEMEEEGEEGRRRGRRQRGRRRGRG